MLRNRLRAGDDRLLAVLLNEVLSLNAQEFTPMKVAIAGNAILNEVLSLNAQEFSGSASIRSTYAVSSMNS